MNVPSLALSLALGTTPTVTTQPKVEPGLAPTPVAVQPPGPPRLLSKEIFDGGLGSIDKGVLVAFGPQGRRYEVWEVQKNVSLNHVLVVAHDAAGAELWRTKYTWQVGETWGDGLAATVDGAGDLYVMYVTTGVANPHRWRLVKVDKAGAIAWHKTLYSTSWGKERSFLAAHPQGGVVVQSTCSGEVRDMYTARVGAAGDVLWERKLDVGGENQFSGGLAVAADGSVYAVGHDDAVHVRKYAADGAIVWTKTRARSTQYEHLTTRHAFLDSEGNLVVAGSTYAGGNDEDWTFVLKYGPQGARLREFTAKIGKDAKLFDYGLQGVYATHGADDSVYFAWDYDEQLDSKWALACVRVPGEDPRAALSGTRPAIVRKETLAAAEVPRVVWTRTFEGDAAMSVEQLVWLPNGAVGVLGRGKRKLEGNDYRADTRLRAVTPAGVDLGMARHGSPGEFHNEPLTLAVDPSGVAYVLGWQYWHGDGWNDENVMRLRFTTRRP